jgi:uncharacterized protein
MRRVRNALGRFRPRDLWSLLVLVGLTFGASAPRAEGVSWLYEVQVPVADQSPRARLEASGSALAQVLTRLTGLTTLPRNEAVDRARAAPDLYYNQFGFRRGPEGEVLLHVQFVPDAVLSLIRQANLPVWRANRPTVLAWAVVDDGTGDRQILNSGADHPVSRALKQRASERGLPLILPLMDIEDQMLVEPAIVWGRLSEPLLEASARYDADILLIGRIQMQPDGNWTGSWEFWLEENLRETEQQAADPARLGAAAADLVSDELAARFAVVDTGSSRRLELAVSAIESAADYADLLRYLGGLEIVDEVDVGFLSGDRLGIFLVTVADPDQLQDMFRLDRRLLPDPLRPAFGPALELVWQRR